jgi:transcriptional regulator with XRE-family HTH domain
MKRPERIRLARRRAGYSQEALAQLLGVKRSAVANWEATSGASPCGANLERLAEVLKVAYEWLATGRGEMRLPPHYHEMAVLDAELIENPVERRLLQAWRALPVKPRVLFLELAESYPGRKSR